MRVKLLRHPKFRVGTCQFLLVISFAFLHAAAFGEDRTVSDSFAHYSEGEVPVPIFCGGASGGSAFEFTIEFEPLAALNEKIKQNCAKGTANKPVDEFTELAKQKDLESMGGDAFSDYYRFLPPAIALSEVAKGEGQFGDSGAPTLSGSTDGIGPTRTEAFPPCELLNIIFSRPYVSPCLVKAALSIVRPARKVQMRAVASKPFFTKETALCELLQIARRIKSEPSLRVLQYTLRVTGKHVGLQESFAWGNVFAEQEKDPILALLFARAAELEKDFVRRQFYLVSAACYRKDWDDAWRHFQKVHKAAESDAEMAREIVKTYRDTNVQDLELCIWLTRYLKVAKDWDSFELAYEERERIEYESYERYLASEPGHNFAWPIKRLPLKVCFDFEGSDHAELKRIVEDSLGDWTRSTGGKIDFIETVDRKNADLVYKWDDDPPRYSQYENSTSAPLGLIRPQALADTDVDMGQQVRRATIRFHGDSCGHQYRDEQELKLVCLHETGHALGIYRHLKDTNAIMNAFAKENDVSPYLTEKDKETICSLYQNHPVNQSAVMKFIGQLAVSQKLDESLDHIAEDVQRSSLLPVSISDAHFGKR